MIVAPTAVLLSSLGDSVQQLVRGLHENSLEIPAPRASVADWPVVGEKVHAIWSQAHADLPALVQSMQPMIGDLAKEFGSKVRGFTPNALIAINKYDWPGNVRQLENRLKKAIVLCDKTLIGPEDLDLQAEAISPILTLTQAREEFQRRYILEVLERNNGNRTKTARDLGVDPRTIFRYLEREGDAPEPGEPVSES